MPQTVNDELRDALIRHQVYLLRYSASLRNRFAALLDATEQDVADQIRKVLRKSDGLRTPADVARLNKLMGLIKEIRGEAWDHASADFEDQLKQLAASEPVFIAGIMSTLSPVELELTMPPERQMIGIVTARPFEGRLLSEWAETMAAEDLRRIQSAIQMGMISGESADEITRRVMGTAKLDGIDGITEISRRQVQAIVRTAVQSVANSVRDEFFQENEDVMDLDLFVATLDGRTTAICRALDGKQFVVGTGPRPPLHFNCRSIRVAVFDGNVLGSRPAKAGTRRELLDEFAQKNDLEDVATRDDLPYGLKTKFDAYERQRIRELTGQVPAATTYQEWLSRQSVAFQNDVLGKTKADLFRKGDLTLDKFVSVSGKELTLEQLALKYPDAFTRAGLNVDDYIRA